MLKKILITTLSVLVVSFPLIWLFASGEYDIEQFFVPNSFNYEVTPFIKLTKEHYLIQSFTARADQLTGFDLVLSQNLSPVSYELVDSRLNEVVRKGELTMKGEVRITKVRFSPINVSAGQGFELMLQGKTGEGPYLAYTDKGKSCRECSLVIDGEAVDGNANIVPVYKATSLKQYFKIVFSRLRSNLSVYLR